MNAVQKALSPEFNTIRPTQNNRVTYLVAGVAAALFIAIAAIYLRPSTFISTKSAKQKLIDKFDNLLSENNITLNPTNILEFNTNDRTIQDKIKELESINSNNIQFTFEDMGKGVRSEDLIEDIRNFNLITMNYSNVSARCRDNKKYFSAHGCIFFPLGFGSNIIFNPNGENKFYLHEKMRANNNKLFKLSKDVFLKAFNILTDPEIPLIPAKTILSLI